MSSAAQAVVTRARWAYEWARLRRALLGALPVVLVVAGAAAATTTPAATATAGVILVAASVVALWRGQGHQRAFLPGLVAGVPPLVLALCATHLGHAWLGELCMPVCLAACALGGLGGGLLVGRWARRTGAPLMQLGAAAGFGILTGTLGSSCVGVTGVALVAAAFLPAAVALPLLAPSRPRGDR